MRFWFSLVYLFLSWKWSILVNVLGFFQSLLTRFHIPMLSKSSSALIPPFSHRPLSLPLPLGILCVCVFLLPPLVCFPVCPPMSVLFSLSAGLNILFLFVVVCFWLVYFRSLNLIGGGFHCYVRAVRAPIISVLGNVLIYSLLVMFSSVVTRRFDWLMEKLMGKSRDYASVISQSEESPLTCASVISQS